MLTNEGIIAAGIKMAMLLNNEVASDIRHSAQVKEMKEDEYIAFLSHRLVEAVHPKDKLVVADERSKKEASDLRRATAGKAKVT